MYNNPTCVQSNTTVTTTSVPATHPDYSIYVPYFINLINDRAVVNSYYGGAHTSRSAAYRTYRSYLQLDTSPILYRQARTIPTRTQPPKIYKMVYTKRNRGYAIDPYFFNARQYRSYSGPWKDARKWPMYRKKKEPSGRIETYQESEFGGNPIDRQPRYCHGLYRVQWNMQPTALRRIRPYYAPSYATYPPSIMNAVSRKEKYNERYSIMMRVAIKAIELMLGAATVGFIISPVSELSLYAFVKMTHTEWQGLVLAVSGSFSALCLFMLFGSFFGNRYMLWRRFDYLISLVGSFGYLFVGVIEAYYATCHPPDSKKIIGLVCHRLEWIIATALIFINVIVYIVDCVLSFRTGIKMIDIAEATRALNFHPSMLFKIIFKQK
ncbi:Uncharacterized protein BM_BM3028 [Brugia malayi]|uniref:MARVEL domain-containing protein n=1 Tax=Brugia malayi TaxID=6279 RepID=A0A4E9FMN7_BRUMA|nr:Uncharacterized protein BM_BM3028 [Brugia malayi]VIO96808.1 Uncharacterized protein BM_BM3028 [Brugia malayi]